MLVWLDLETTGLNAREDDILEVAAILTTDKLERIADFQAVVYSPACREVLEPASYFPHGKHTSKEVVEMHTKSGLWQLVRYGQNIHTVDADLANLIVNNKGDNEKVMLAGSSIWFDKSFMARQMPRALAEMTYRVIDVSSIHETARLFFPGIHAKAPECKDKLHRAMVDITDSLELYRYYISRLGCPVYERDAIDL